MVGNLGWMNTEASNVIRDTWNGSGIINKR
jgi:hypothetical protein